MNQSPRRDLLYTQEIKALVRDTYHAVASPAGAVASKLYSAEELAQQLKEAAEIPEAKALLTQVQRLLAQRSK